MPVSDKNPLIRMVEKLAEHAKVSDEARAEILQMPYVARQFEPGSYFVREGALADKTGVLMSGLAVCQKTSGAGDRQIVSIKIAGDILGLQNLYLDTPDHNIQALTQCDIIIVSSKVLKTAPEAYPAVSHAITLMMLKEASMLRELLLNIGRRDALARVAHFLCKFATRIDGPDKINNRSFELPMTQEQLGDALGLTAVHINRMLKVLARDSLIARNGKTIRFIDWDRLQEVADFSTRHLHLHQ